MTTNKPLTVRDLIAALAKLPGDTPVVCPSGNGFTSALSPVTSLSDIDLYTTMFHGEIVLYSAWQSPGSDNGKPLDFGERVSNESK